MIQRHQLLRDMRSCTLSSESTGTSFLVPLTIDSMKKLSGPACYQARGVIGGLRIGDSEMIRSVTKSRSLDNDLSEVYSNDAILLKQFAADNAALRSKLEAVANERNQYRDQFLAGVQEASRRSLMNGISSFTYHRPEVTPESLVETSEESALIIENLREEVSFLNDLLQVRRTAAVAHEKESSENEMSKLEKSTNIEELRAMCVVDITVVKNLGIAAMESQMKELTVEFDKRIAKSVKDWTIRLEETNLLRTQEKEFYACKLGDMSRELEQLRAPATSSLKPSICEKLSDKALINDLIESLQSDHLMYKMSTLAMMNGFSDYFMSVKEEMITEIRRKLEEKDTQYALNLNLKDHECQNLHGQNKILDCLLSVAQTSKLKILCQVRNLYECATSGVTEIAEKHVQFVQSVQHDTIRKETEHDSAIKRIILERDCAADELLHSR